MAAGASTKELILKVDAATEVARRNLAELERDVARGSAKMDASLGRIDGASARLGKSFDSLKGAAGGFLAVVGAGAILNAGKNMLQFADDLATAADQAGISVEKYQTLKEALRTLEIDATAADKIFKTFQTTIGDVQNRASNSATKAFDKLGLSSKILAGEITSTDQAIEYFAAASGKAGTEAQYTALAVDVLGKKLGVDFAAASNDGGAALMDLQQKMIDSGMVIESALIAKLADANEAIDKFKDDAGRSLTIFAGGVIDTFEALDGAFDPAADGWLSSIVDFVTKGRGLVNSFARDMANFLKQYDDVKNAGFTITEKIDDLAGAATFGLLKPRRFERSNTSGKFLQNLTRNQIMSGDPFADMPQFRPRARSSGAGGVARPSVGGGGSRARSRPPGGSRGRGGSGARAARTPQERPLTAGARAFEALGPDEPLFALDFSHSVIDIEKINAAVAETARLMSAIPTPDLSKILPQEDQQRLERFALDFKDDLAAGLTDAIIYGENLGDVLEDTFKRAAAAMVQSGILNFLTGGREGTSFGTLFANVGKLFGGGRAAGGPVDPSKFYMVGEKGPELFQPRVSGSIIPNHAMRGGGTTNHFHIDAKGAEIGVERKIAAAIQAAVPGIVSLSTQATMRAATRTRL